MLGAVAPRAQADAPRMLKGPYLQNLAPTSITVMYVLDAPSPAKLVIDGPGGRRIQEVAPARIAEATVEGLAPASRYRYRVEVGTAEWHGDFATAPEVGKDVPFSFVVIGDTRDNTDAFRRVVDRMAQEVPDFVLGTGDMVDDGKQEEQWQQFFDVENQMFRNNVYFPALGNHDRQGRGRTADAYRAYFSVPDNGSDSERYYAFTYATSRFLVLDSNEYSFALTDQTAWLERELIAARQDAGIRHVFVVMHHPPFSISLHGGAVDLRERWTPLFDKYQVSAVFSGHDHVYERAEHNGIRYFVSGGGGASLYPRRPRSNPVDTEAVKMFERVYHYLRVTLTGNRVEVTGIRSDGTTIETTTWTEGVVPTPIAAAEPDPQHQPAVGAASAAPSATPSSSIRVGAAPEQEARGDLLWVGLAGVVLVLGASLVVVRSLR